MSPRKLAHVLIEGIKEKGEKEILKIFLDFVEERNLTHLLPSVLTYLERIHLQEEKAMTLTIHAPFEISSDLIHRIQEYIHAQDALRVEKIVDPELLGGFKAVYRGTLVDATMRNQILKLRQKLVS